ncbi:hypothetical protein ACU17_15845 [Xanthomonas oryzae pv. oryzicola]|nr:hypothetical protein ACU17_15845 [Xanthomonas oryzae pv. oryzicola]
MRLQKAAFIPIHGEMPDILVGMVVTHQVGGHGIAAMAGADPHQQQGVQDAARELHHPWPHMRLTLALRVLVAQTRHRLYAAQGFSRDKSPLTIGRHRQGPSGIIRHF